jgi:stage V sporulation protein G
MEITDVRVFPVNQDKLRAFVSIVLDGCFVIGDIKVISGTNGLFISMPSKRRKDGSFRDVAHPLNSETRLLMEDRIIAAYRQEVGDESDTRTLGQEVLDDEGPLEDAFPG